MKFSFDLRKLGLQSRMMAAFLLMALLVFIVGSIGKAGTEQLSENLHEISLNRVPSIMGLQLMNNGIREIYAQELALLNPNLSEMSAKNQLAAIEASQERIKQGYAQYEPLARTPEEDILWDKFKGNWDRFQQEHKKFMQLYIQFAELGIRDPDRLQLELIDQNKGKSPEMAKAQVASQLLQQINILVLAVNRPIFNNVISSIEKVIEENEKIADETNKVAEKNINNTNNLMLVGIIIGVLVAIILGLFLSKVIAKPLDVSLKKVINQIGTSSNEIAVALEEQERVAAQQATAVNETTATMNELDVSSQRSAQQAELAANRSNQALNIANQGNKTVLSSLLEMEKLQHQVNTLSAEIMRLKNTTGEIGSISSVVKDLANQTNMLALNAAVEAVRAGDYGKGFGVVAAEIRKLAEESKSSVNKINGLVIDIENAINSTVEVADLSSQNVDDSFKEVEKMTDAFNGVVELVKQSVLNSQEISLTAKQQAMAIKQVLEVMNDLNLAARETVAGFTQSRNATEELNQVILQLKRLV